MKKTLKKMTSWLCLAAMLMSMLPATIVPAFAAEATHEDHADHAGWTEVAEGGTIPASGNVVLTGDVVAAAAAIPVEGDLHICLNGNNIKLDGKTGAMFAVADGDTLTICDCAGTGVIGDNTGDVPADISYVVAADIGAALINMTGGELNLYGGTFAGIRGSTMGAVVQASDAEVNMYDGAVITKTVGEYWGGAMSFAGESVFNMYGGSVSNNVSIGGGGGAFALLGTAVANIYDGTMEGNISATNGGAVVFQSATATLNVSGGSLSYNKAGQAEDTSSKSGGAISSIGTVNITGGTFEGNAAGIRETSFNGKNGGAVSSTGTLNISGGTFTNNHASNVGGGIYVGNGTASFTGGTFTGNVAGKSSTPQDFHSYGGATTISGNPVFAAFTYSAAHTNVTVGNLTEGASIKSALALTVAEDDDTVKVDGTTYTFAAPQLTADSFAANSTVVLKKDTALVGNVSTLAAGEYVLDLNGHTLYPDANGARFTLGAGVKLTIKDSVGGGKFVGVDGQTTVLLSVSGELVLESGKITDVTTTAVCAVEVAAGGKFTMAGGEISNITSTASNGYGAVRSSGTFVMTGGTIANCTGGNVGSAVRLESGDANATFTGGVIATSNKSPAVVSVAKPVAVSGNPSIPLIQYYGEGGTLTVGTLTEGASIKSSIAADLTNAVDCKDMGSNTYVWLDPNAPTELTADSFAANSTVVLKKDTALGGHIDSLAEGEYVLDLNGHTLYPKSNGARITVPAGVKLTIKDSVGGGKFVGIDGQTTSLLIVSGELVLESGKITDVTTTAVAVVDVAAGGKFTMAGGEISNITASSYGAVRCNGTFVMTGGTIANCTGGNVGSALRLESGDANATFTGGVIATSNKSPAVVSVAKPVAVSGNPSIPLIQYYGEGGTLTVGTLTEGASFKSSIAADLTNAVNCKDMGSNTYTYLDPNSLTMDSFASGTATLTEDATLAGVLTLTEGGDYTLDLNGKTLSVAAAGSQIVVPVDTTLTIKDSGTDGTFKGMQGNNVHLIYVYGTLNLEGGIITGNKTAASSTGTITVEDGGVLNMTGGKITGNEAYYGGLYIKGTFIMTDGEISNNETNNAGSGIRVQGANASVVITGGKIVENESFDIAMVSGELYVGGSAEIEFIQQYGGTSYLLPLEPGATVTSSAALDTTDAEDFRKLGDFVYVYKDPNAAPILTGDDFANGEVVLAADTDLASAISLAEGEYVLDLNGKTLSVVAAGSQIVVNSGVKLTVTDSVGGGKFVGTDANGVSLFKVNAGGELLIEDGTFTENTSANGGVVYNSGTTTITGGTFTNNKSTGSSGVIAMGSVDAVLNISGGTFEGNKAAGASGRGGVAYLNSGTTTITGGTFTGNRAANNGSAFFIGGTGAVTMKDAVVTGNCYGLGESTSPFDIGLESGTLAISGSTQIGLLTIYKDQAVSMSELTKGADIKVSLGAAVVTPLDVDGTVKINGNAYTYLDPNAPAELTAADFANGTVTLTKNAVLVESVTLAEGEYVLDLNGFTLTIAKEATKITVPAGVKLTVQDSGENGQFVGSETNTTALFHVSGELVLDGGTITGNHANSTGGAVALSSGTFTMNGGAITNCSAVHYGGAIFAEGASEITINDGTFEGNKTAQLTGGAIHAYKDGSTVVTVNGGTFTANQGTSGGAIYVGSGSSVTVNGGVFTANSAATAHGGAVMGEGGNVTITGGTFTENTTPAGGNGGAVYVGNAVATISGGEYANNTTGNGTGAVYFSNATATITGGAFTGTVSTGGVYVYKGTTAISGNPTIASLVLYDNEGAGVLTEATIGGLTEGAAIKANKALNVTEDGTVKVKDGNKYIWLDPNAPDELTADAFVDGEVTVLDADAIIVETIVLSDGSYTLDLNGKSLTLEDAGKMFVVSEYTTLTIVDSSAAENGIGTGIIVGLTDNTSTLIEVAAEGELIVDSGVISGNTATSGGAAINSAGYLTITGGKFENNKSLSGHGGAISSTGFLTITGGEFVGNAVEGAGKNGGAIYVYEGGIATIEGGSFTENSTNNAGAALFFEGGSTGIITTGTFTNNVGGDIGVSGSTLAISGNPVIDEVTGYGDYALTLDVLTEGAYIYTNSEVDVSALVEGVDYSVVAAEKEGFFIYTEAKEDEPELPAEPEEYTVSYNANGGEGAPAAQTKVEDVDLVLSDVIPTMEGYEFLGWATEVDGAVAYAAGATYTANAAVTLYAVWEKLPEPEPEPEQYTVSYNANGGEGAPVAQTKIEGEDLTLSTTEPTRATYEFLGWATEVDGAVVYAAGATYTADADVTLYAVWEPVSTATITAKAATLLYESMIQIRYKFAVTGSDIVERGMYVFASAEDAATLDLTKAFEVKELEVYPDGSYGYTDGILSNKMGDSQFVVGYVKQANGAVAYASAVEYSPRIYARRMVDKAGTSAVTVALCHALMNYGAAAQIKFGYKTDALMNEGFEAVAYDAAVLGEEVFRVDTTLTNGFTTKAATLLFEGAITYRLKYTASNAISNKPLYLEYTLKGTTGSVEMVLDSGAYYAYVSGIAAADMDEALVAKPYYLDDNGDKVYGAELVYSGYEYVRRTVAGTGAEDNKNLAKTFAMYVSAVDAALPK